jgi:hypothetical protein
MTLTIPAEELQISPEWKISSLLGVSIDYADQLLYGSFQGTREPLPIFDFSSYGLRLDNRKWGYHTSVGKAGILIQIIQS